MYPRGKKGYRARRVNFVDLAKISSDSHSYQNLC